MYNEIYDNSDIRNGNTDFTDFVISHLTGRETLVDLGCGTCRKVIALSPFVSHIDAIDRNDAMLKCASLSLEKAAIKNVALYSGDNINTPFESHAYDVCTTALSVWSTAEVHRLLKPDGLFFIETLSPNDKREVKRAFGSDELGERGYLGNRTEEERLIYLRTSLGAFFDITDVKRVERETTLSEDGFIKLLEVTPTVRGFSIERDGETVKRLVSNGCVSFTEVRFMISARAKNIGGNL